MTRIRLLACLGVGFMFACSDSTNAIDGGSAIDGAGSAVDAAGTAKVFNVALTKAGETPVCANAGASAAGSAKVTVSADDSTITVENFMYTGLSTTASAAHIHFGTAAAPGPVVLPFASAASGQATITFHASDYVAATGAPATFAAFVTMVRAGNGAYINVHTAGATFCPNGEIRGELQ